MLEMCIDEMQSQQIVTRTKKGGKCNLCGHIIPAASLPCLRGAVLWVSLLPGAARTPPGAARWIPPLSVRPTRLRVSAQNVSKSYISSSSWASGVSFTIPGEYSGEFAELPDRSNDLLGVLNFYFTHRQAGSGI